MIIRSGVLVVLKVRSFSSFLHSRLPSELLVFHPKPNYSPKDLVLATLRSSVVRPDEVGPILAGCLLEVALKMRRLTSVQIKVVFEPENKSSPGFEIKSERGNDLER